MQPVGESDHWQVKPSAASFAISNLLAFEKDLAEFRNLSIYSRVKDSTMRPNGLINDVFDLEIVCNKLYQGYSSIHH